MPLEDGRLWHVHHGDCVPHMHAMPEGCMSFCLYSPPFPSVYAYSSSEADLGNSEDLKGDGKLHLSFFFRAVRRVLRPGRVMVVHVAQIVRMRRSGGDGMFDFRGLVIRLGERAGFVYDYDWVVRKNPQSQAIRTKSRSLQFAGLESDRAKSRGAMGDYLIKFRAPGDSPAVNAPGEVSRNEWIEWAECCWGDVRETDTLNAAEGRGVEDTKHIAPLQLGVIDRLVRLYSDPGEVVFSPFAGIGSEGYIAVKRGRRFYGCELKTEYHAAALKNLARAEREAAENNASLFDKVMS